MIALDGYVVGIQKFLLVPLLLLYCVCLLVLTVEDVLW